MYVFSSPTSRSSLPSVRLLLLGRSPPSPLLPLRCFPHFHVSLSNIEVIDEVRLVSHSARSLVMIQSLVVIFFLLPQSHVDPTSAKTLDMIYLFFVLVTLIFHNASQHVDIFRDFGAKLFLPSRFFSSSLPFAPSRKVLQDSLITCTLLAACLYSLSLSPSQM